LAVISLLISIGLTRSAGAQITITLDDATVERGASAAFAVRIDGVASSGHLVNNAQVDILLPRTVFAVTTADAVCQIDPRLGDVAHTETLPEESGDTADIERLRLNVIDTVFPLGGITDGRLYTCSFPVKTTAPRGVVDIVGVRHNVGDTRGNVLRSQVSGGRVTVVDTGRVLPNGEPCFDRLECSSGFCVDSVCCETGGCAPGWSCRVPGKEGLCSLPSSPTATWTPIATGTSTATPTSTAVPLQIALGQTQAESGGVAVFTVTLQGVAGRRAAINNAQIDILFPIASFDVATPTVCRIDARLAALTHTETLLADSDVSRGRLRLSVIDTVQPLGEVTDGLLYTCSFPVRPDADRGRIALVAVRPNVGDTSGRVQTVHVVDGSVAIFDSAANLLIAEPCLAAAECASTFCVDGICCTRACPPFHRCDLAGVEGRCEAQMSQGGLCAHDADCISENCMSGNPPVCGPRKTPTRTPTATPGIRPQGCASTSQCALGFFCEEQERVCCDRLNCPIGWSCRFPNQEGHCVELIPTPTPRALGDVTSQDSRDSDGCAVDTRAAGSALSWLSVVPWLAAKRWKTARKRQWASVSTGWQAQGRARNMRRHGSKLV